MSYSICSKIFLIPSGRSLNLVDFVKGAGSWLKAELLRLGGWPKLENPVFWVELVNLRDES